MTNLEYFQNKPIEFLNSALSGILALDNTTLCEQPTESLQNWLNTEFDEQVLKDKLQKYCEKMDRINQTFVEAHGVSGNQICDGK